MRGTRPPLRLCLTFEMSRAVRFVFWFQDTRCRVGRLSDESAGAVAAVLKDAFLEERRELADGVLGETKTAFCVRSEWRACGRQHHLEQVPQVTLQETTAAVSGHAHLSDLPEPHRNLPPSDSGAPRPSAHLCFQTVSSEGNREPPAETDKSSVRHVEPSTT